MKYSKDTFDLALSKLIEEEGQSLRALWRNKRLPFHYTYISKLALGKRKAPDNKSMEAIAKAFKVEPDYFLEYRLRKIEEEVKKKASLSIDLYEILKSPKKREFLKTLNKLSLKQTGEIQKGAKSLL